ncbi:MAG: type II toxin-antitoxin system VapC family toxin [Armatimonadota bacterium]
MSLRDLDAFFSRHALVGLDTMVFVYQAQRLAPYDRVCARIFDALARSPGMGCTSTISLAEVLVKPMQAGRLDLAHRYRTLMAHSAILTMLPVTESVAERAALLRAQHGLRLADALQLAATALAGATGFVTNDAIFRRIQTPEILMLDDMVGSS